MTFIPDVEIAINAIQPLSDDFSTDGYLPEFARIDHQHGLSESLRAAIFGFGGGGSGNQTSQRNYAHNGQFNINQRALNAIVGVGVGAFLADRWQVSNNAVGVQNLNYGTKGAFSFLVPLNRPQPANYQYLQVTTIDAALAAGDYTIIVQGIEGQNLQYLGFGTTTAKSLTVSFDAFCSTAGTFVLELQNIGATTRYIARSFTLPAAQWTTVILTYPGDVGQALTNDSASRLQLVFWVAAGTTFTGGGVLQTDWGTVVNQRAFGITNNHPAVLNSAFSITNVQVEAGGAASPYELRPFQDELQTCMRYFERFTALFHNNAYFGSGFNYAATNAVVTVPFKVIKRAGVVAAYSAANTFAVYNAGGGLIALTVIATHNAEPHQLGITCTVAAGLVAGNGNILLANTVNTTTIDANSEI